jgi:hypothetical protein
MSPPRSPPQQPDRWTRIAELFHEAAELPPGERPDGEAALGVGDGGEGCAHDLHHRVGKGLALVNGCDLARDRALLCLERSSPEESESCQDDLGTPLADSFGWSPVEGDGCRERAGSPGLGPGAASYETVRFLQETRKVSSRHFSQAGPVRDAGR